MDYKNLAYIIEIIIALISAIVTYMYVNRRRGYNSYVVTWKLLGKRLLTLLVFFAVIIIYFSSLNKIYSYGSAIKIIIGIIMVMFILLIVVALCIWKGYSFIKQSGKEKNIERGKTNKKNSLGFTETFDKISKLRYDTISHITYLLEIVFNYSLLFTSMSLIFDFYMQYDKLFKDIHDLFYIQNTIIFCFGIIACICWITDFLFILFRLRKYFDEKSVDREDENYKHEQDKNMEIIKIEHDDNLL